MKVLIENYRNLTAGHCGSGAMRNLIYHYCGLELDEGVVFGLGAGLDTVFFTYEAQSPPFMLFGRGSSMEADLAHTLGMDYSEHIQLDDDLAWEEVRQEVVEGRPTMLSGDILYLDYREYKVHFPAHRFVLLGFDEDKQEVYIADRTREQTEVCSMGALRTSRNPTEAISTYNAWGKFSSGEVRHSLPEACGIALRKTVERMQGMDMSQRDLMSSFSGGNDTLLEVGLKGLQTFSDQLQIWPDLKDAGEHAQYVDNAIVKYGTGGGFFRDHFASFMHWASHQRPDLVTSSTVLLAQEAADRWNQLSPTMRQLAASPSDSQGWKSAQSQVEDIYEAEYSLFGHLADKVLRTG
ncbi:MAG: BtrH N-terminal domain-containing protein [Halioglobus sp.]